MGELAGFVRVLAALPRPLRRQPALAAQKRNALERRVWGYPRLAQLKNGYQVAILDPLTDGLERERHQVDFSPDYRQARRHGPSVTRHELPIHAHEMRAYPDSREARAPDILDSEENGSPLRRPHDVLDGPPLGARSDGPDLRAPGHAAQEGEIRSRVRSMGIAPERRYEEPRHIEYPHRHAVGRRLPEDVRADDILHDDARSELFAENRSDKTCVGVVASAYGLRNDETNRPAVEVVTATVLVLAAQSLPGGKKSDAARARQVPQERTSRTIEIIACLFRAEVSDELECHESGSNLSIQSAARQTGRRGESGSGGGFQASCSRSYRCHRCDENLSSKPEPLRPSRTLQPWATTSKSSRAAESKQDDGTIIVLRPNTKILFESNGAAQTARGKVRTTKLKLDQGSFLSRVQKLAQRDSRFDYETCVGELLGSCQ